MKVEEYGKCQCGTITIYTEDGQNYFLMEENVPKFGIDLTQAELINPDGWCNCNHCANHWGLDLCACGSVEPPEECDGGFEECGNPMQIIK